MTKRWIEVFSKAYDAGYNWLLFGRGTCDELISKFNCKWRPVVLAGLNDYRKSPVRMFKRKDGGEG